MTPEEKREYYGRTQTGQYARRWTRDEIAHIKRTDIDDHAIAALINRSVMAIQIKRSRLRGIVVMPDKSPSKD